MSADHNEHRVEAPQFTGYEVIRELLSSRLIEQAGADQFSHSMAIDAIGLYDELNPLAVAEQVEVDRDRASSIEQAQGEWEDSNYVIVEHALEVNDTELIDAAFSHVQPYQQWQLLAKMFRKQQSESDNPGIDPAAYGRWYALARDQDSIDIFENRGPIAYIYAVLARNNTELLFNLAEEHSIEDKLRAVASAYAAYADSDDPRRKLILTDDPEVTFEFDLNASTDPTLTSIRKDFAHICGEAKFWQYSDVISGISGVPIDIYQAAAHGLRPKEIDDLQVRIESTTNQVTLVESQILLALQGDTEAAQIVIDSLPRLESPIFVDPDRARAIKAVSPALWHEILNNHHIAPVSLDSPDAIDDYTTARPSAIARDLHVEYENQIYGIEMRHVNRATPLRLALYQLRRADVVAYDPATDYALQTEIHNVLTFDSWHEHTKHVESKKIISSGRSSQLGSLARERLNDFNDPSRYPDMATELAAKIQLIDDVTVVDGDYRDQLRTLIARAISLRKALAHRASQLPLLASLDDRLETAISDARVHLLIGTAPTIPRTENLDLGPDTTLGKEQANKNITRRDLPPNPYL